MCNRPVLRLPSPYRALPVPLWGVYHSPMLRLSSSYGALPVPEYKRHFVNMCHPEDEQFGELNTLIMTLELPPDHFVDYTNVGLDDAHHLGAHVLIDIIGYRDAWESILDKADSYIDALE